MRQKRFILAVLLPLLFAGSQVPVIGQESAQATITLELELKESMLAELEVTFLCTSGEPRQQSFIQSEGSTFEWKVSGFDDAATYCQVYATLPRGYNVAYLAAGDSPSKSDEHGCHYAEVRDTHGNHCRIMVRQDHVSISVYKKWIGGADDNPDVMIRLDCHNEHSFGDRYINQGLPASWQVDVIPPNGLECDVSEVPQESFKGDESDCHGLFLLPGKGEECTMINTKVVKRIEMLNRYGKAIMILVMLVAGLTAVRRYV